MIIEVEGGLQYDRFTVSVMADDEIVGRMPCSISKLSWPFLNHGEENKCKVIGRRPKGNELKVPCLCVYIGSPRMITKLTCT